MYEAILSNVFMALWAVAGDIQDVIATRLSHLQMTEAVSGGRGPVKAIVSYVLMIFVLFIFATSGLISNANIQTQLKNGAYYAGLFSSLIAILLAIDFLGF